MTRSVEDLRRESERSRAELAATVEQLRERISHTADDIRHKVSPQHIRSEVSGYINHTTQSWVEALEFGERFGLIEFELAVPRQSREHSYTPDAVKVGQWKEHATAKSIDMGELREVLL